MHNLACQVAKFAPPLFYGYARTHRHGTRAVVLREGGLGKRGDCGCGTTAGQLPAQMEEAAPLMGRGAAYAMR